MSEVPACPECNTSNPYHRRPSVQDTQKDHRYRCKECDHRFDTPVMREAQSQDCIPKHTLAAKLDNMNPDEVGL